MFKLVSTSWDQVVLSETPKSKTTKLRLVTPFIKVKVARRLVDQTNPKAIRLLTRFNLNDCVAGVSDLSALRFLLDRGAEIRGVKNLHAKVYIFDSRRAVATSANLTDNALYLNHEFGFDSDDKEVVSECGRYFEQFWKLAGPNLSREQLDMWEGQVNDQKALGAGLRKLPQLDDHGVEVIFGKTSAPPSESTTQAQAFVKFFGEGDDRSSSTKAVLDEIIGSGSHWACTYPKRPRQVQDGSTMYLASITKEPNDIIIYGRGYALAHDDIRDLASPSEIKIRDWKSRYPYYIRVYGVAFVNGNLKNGVSLNELMDVFGAEAFASTLRNKNSGSGNTNPRHAYRQQPAVELTPKAAQWLDQRLERAFTDHGTLASEKLAKLDWPSRSKLGNLRLGM